MDKNNQNHHTYYAFISYQRKDEKWAKWLQRKLENYKLPVANTKEASDKKSKYIRPVFRDKTDLTAGSLPDALKEALNQSRFLIVICSPNAVQSPWVNDEINTFVNLGRTNYIIPFIVNGEPYSNYKANECFPDALKAIPKEQEPLGVNMGESGREKAFIRAVAYMLNVKFDELWHRYKRNRILKRFYFTIALFLSMLAYYLFAIPLNANIELIDEQHHLPMPNDAEIIINELHFKIPSLDTTLTNIMLPGYKKLFPIAISFHGQYYDSISLHVKNTLRYNRLIKLPLHRDSSFAIFAGHILDQKGNPVNHAEIIIENEQTWSDSVGYFRIVFPPKTQSTIKNIIIKKDGYRTIINQEIPYKNATYILFKK